MVLWLDAALVVMIHANHTLTADWCIHKCLSDTSWKLFFDFAFATERKTQFSNEVRNHFLKWTDVLCEEILPNSKILHLISAITAFVIIMLREHIVVIEWIYLIFFISLPCVIIVC